MKKPLTDRELVNKIVQVAVSFGMDVGNHTVNEIKVLKKELLKRLKHNGK